MASAKEKPRYANPADYEDDFYAWTYEQAELLRLGRFREADLPNIIEELETLGRTERRSHVSHYRVLLVHLLKWEFQPKRRTRSWLITIARVRDEVQDERRDNRSFRNDAAQILAEAYRKARNEVAIETDRPKSAYPVECPYSLEQILDTEWLPETPGPDGETTFPVSD